LALPVPSGGVAGPVTIEPVMGVVTTPAESRLSNAQLPMLLGVTSIVAAELTVGAIPKAAIADNPQMTCSVLNIFLLTLAITQSPYSDIPQTKCLMSISRMPNWPH
jgi:hypothetical protein